MKLLVLFALLPCLISARRTGDEDFSSVDRDRRRGSSGSNRFADESPSRVDVPNFVRVEIEIQRLENPGGVLATGKACKFFSGACDPSVSAFLDA